MNGLFASWRRGAISCCLIMASVGSLATPAHAGSPEVASFARTALVTQWSLAPAAKLGSMPKPIFAPLIVGETSPTDSANSFLALERPASTDATAVLPVASHLASADGPSAADDDLEARGAVTYDRKQPYRTPRDIKALEVAFQVLNVADAATTLVCLNQDDCHENNPIYGNHPKPIVVVGAKAAVGALHYLAMRSLLPDNPGLARALGWVSVTIQGTVVGLNISQLL